MSLAGAEAARARREAASRTDYFNLRLGPTAWAFDTAFSLQFNDNLRNSPQNQQSDLILRPQVDAVMRWPISDVNTINLTFGGGYAIYTMHSEYDRPFITPGSELSFDIYAGDFWINLHDRFSIIENGYLDPTITGIGDYLRLDNAAGVSATADLNKILLKFGYDHVSYRALGGLHGQPDADNEVFSFSAGYQLKPGVLAGLEAGASLIRYVNLPNDLLAFLYYSDGTQWNAGAFYDVQLTQYIHGRASIGYSQFLPDSGLASVLQQDFSGVYAQLNLSHRVNKILEYGLNGGRMLNFAYFGGKVDQYFIGLTANWRLFQKTALSTGFNYQHGSQLGFFKEDYHWFGPSIELDRRITEKLTGSLAYQFYWRGSDLPGRDYTVNIVTLRGIYCF